MRAHRGLSPLEQHELRAGTAHLEPRNDRLVRQTIQPDAPLHIHQYGLQIEVLGVGLPRQPSLPPGGERTHQHRQVPAGIGQDVLGAVLAIDPRHRTDHGQRLQSLGQNGARNARNAAADVIESPAPAQQFAHDQDGPPTADHLVGTCHRAELTIARHPRTLAPPADACGTDCGPHGPSA